MINIPKKKTHEEYVKEVKRVNPNIEVVGKYVNSTTKISHKCLVDGYEWESKPQHILEGHGCPLCAGNIKRTHSKYIAEVKLINPTIEVVGEYINQKTKILHRCLIDGFEWETKPGHVLCGHGCPLCARKKVRELNKSTRKTNEEYISEVSALNIDIEVIGKYVNATTKILHKCAIDGCEWYASPNNILHGYGCPECNESKGERGIRHWLSSHNIYFQREYCFHNCRDIYELPFDFYLPNYNSCIEFDGDQHRKPIEFFGGDEAFKMVVKHDQIKEEYCAENNISLLRINKIKDIDRELRNFLFE